MPQARPPIPLVFASGGPPIVSGPSVLSSRVGGVPKQTPKVLALAGYREQHRVSGLESGSSDVGCFFNCVMGMRLGPNRGESPICGAIEDHRVCNVSKARLCGYSAIENDLSTSTVSWVPSRQPLAEHPWATLRPCLDLEEIFRRQRRGTSTHSRAVWRGSKPSFRPHAVSGPNWSRRPAKRPWRESSAYPGRPSRIACVASERTTRGGAAGEKRKEFLCVFPWLGVCSVEVPERREPVQPPAVKAHLGPETSAS